MADKYLEKIRKFWAKGQLEKAWQLSEELLKQGRPSPELESLSFGLCLCLYSWTEVLTRFKENYRDGQFLKLCGGENRQIFVTFVRENPGFRTGLSDYLCSIQAYEGLADWMRLCDDYDQQWLIEHWLSAAGQMSAPSRRAALKVAAGIGYAIRQDSEIAWRTWIEAVGSDLALLPKVMSFLQDSRLLDMKHIQNRLQIIRMLLVAGRRKEALQLLLVMGCESEDHALKVLLAIPGLFPGDVTYAVLELRFNLALFLQDEEILADVISDMAALSEDNLFQFKKMAVLKISVQPLQRRVILFFCKVYMQKDMWESAALILEGLFVEEPDDDVVSLMGEVLDNYPMLPELNFSVGQYYLQKNQIDLAMKYWNVIKASQEFRAKIKRLLEQRLIEKYDETCAEFLFEMLRRGGNRAGLVAFWILKHQNPVDQRFLGRMEHGLLRSEIKPLWAMALLYGFTKAENYPLVLDHLEHFLEAFPDLSAEVLVYAEVLPKRYPHDFSSLRRFLEVKSSRLIPAKAWEALALQLQDAARAYATGSSGPQPLRERSQQTLIPDENIEYSAFFEAFQERVFARNWAGAAELASKAATRVPVWREAILKQTDQLRENQPDLWDWARLRLELLLMDGKLTLAEKELGDAIRNPEFRNYLPWLYQKLGETEHEMGKHRAALSAFVLASADARNYRKNRKALPFWVKAAGGQQFRDVLNLIHKASDEEVWEQMMRVWYEEKPGDLKLIVSTQKAFTEKVNSSPAYLELAYWSLQSGYLKGFQEALKKVDLRQIQKAETLVHLTDLANLKYPTDATAKFALGRFYTIHREIPRAVDTFRNLLQVNPDQAEAVYHYLRSYLTNQPECPDRVHLYGLLIRIALDYQLSSPAVKLLDEFSQLDLDSAKGLAPGVQRVLLKSSENNREALVLLGGLLKKWQSYDALLELEEQADFAKDMASERLDWLAAIKEQPALSSRAAVHRARIFLARQEFEACRKELADILDEDVKTGAADIYEKLLQRFPNDYELHHTACWVFDRAKHPQAIAVWSYLFQSADADKVTAVAAYAALREWGESPDQERLNAIFSGDVNALLGSLRQVFGQRREMDLERAESGGDSPSEEALHYLLATSQLERFAAYFQKADALSEESRLRLEARYLQRQGLVFNAAKRIAFSRLPADFRQSLLHEAGLIELAVAVNPMGERLSAALRSKFAHSAKKPKVILARFDFLERSRKARAMRDAQTVMVNQPSKGN